MQATGRCALRWFAGSLGAGSSVAGRTPGPELLAKGRRIYAPGCESGEIKAGDLPLEAGYRFDSGGQRLLEPGRRQASYTSS